MPSHKAENQLIAREKALKTRVYVSGLKGDHNLETGLAYYYRGHYLYACPGGTLIEPIPYSTKRGIMFHGMVSPSAPTYNGSSARLVTEDSIRALEASIKNELGSRSSPPALNQVGEEFDVGASGGYTDLLLRNSSPSLVAPSAATPFPSPARVSALCQDTDSILMSSPSSSLSVPSSSIRAPTPSPSVPAPSLPIPTFTYTPHADAAFLAASAPESRLTSPLPSTSSRGTMRSSQRLSAIREDQNRTPTPAYRPSSAIGYHDRTDNILSRPDMQCATAAARELKSKPCALHGELCDGMTTMWEQETEVLRRRRGFVAPTPMVMRGARVMIDWTQLLEEAWAKQGWPGQSDEQVD